MKGGNLDEMKGFPSNWAKNIDFIPILSLQVKLNEKFNRKDQKIYFLKGKYSFQTSKNPLGEQPRKTSYGGLIKPSNEARNKIEVIYPDVSKENSYLSDIENYTELSLKKILDDLREELGISHVKIDKKGEICNVPENVSDIELFQTANSIYHLQVFATNRHKEIKEKLGIRTDSTYRIISPDLFRQNILSPYKKETKDILMRLRYGVLKTEYAIPDNKKGWGDYVKSHALLRLLRGLRNKQYDLIRGKSWWQDTALPTKYYITTLNETIRVYRLDDRRDNQIAL